MSDRDLSIAYRVYPEFSETAFKLDGWDKYDLVEVCLMSFLDSISDLDYKMYVVLDSCPSKYKKLFKEEIPSERLEILEFSEMGNSGTFNKQIDTLLSQDESDTVYFAEDDYLYSKDSFSDMLSVINHKGVDFVSPYDHPDYYQDEIESEKPDHIKGLHNYRSEVMFEKRHWRTVSSTTCTFLTTKSKLEEAKECLELYPKLGDYGMWLTLTKIKRSSYSLPKTLEMYFWARWKLISGNRYNLVTPIPSIATHMDELYLAKGINWTNIIERYC